MKLDLDTTNTIEDLYINQRLSQTQIGKILNKHRSTIESYMHRHGITTRKRTEATYLHCGNRKEVDLGMDENLAYIIGVALGDGYIWAKEPKTTKAIRLKVKSGRFVNSFQAAVERLGISTNRFYDRRDDEIELKVHSTSLGRFISRFKEEPNKLTEEIRNQKEKIAFLRGYYESDGCLTYNKRWPQIYITDGNLALLCVAKNFIRDLGFESSVYNRKTYYTLYLKGKSKEKMKFLSILNPCIKNSASTQMA